MIFNFFNILLNNYFLSLLALLPLIFILLLLLFKKYDNNNFEKLKLFSLFLSLFILAMGCYLLYIFDINSSNFQLSNYYFNNNLYFNNFLNINFSLGLDGISIFFVILSIFLIPFCILCSWNSLKIRVRDFFIFLFLLEFFLIMVFSVHDILLFYIFFELILIPMYFLIIIWGSRSRKILAANRFFMYTLFGSLFMLVGIIYILNTVGSTDIFVLYSYNFTSESQILLFFFFFFSTLIKVPMVPLHIWLPEAHVEAPTAGSVILAGILLKMGGYAIIRFILPLFPIGCIFFKPIIFAMSVIGIIYPSLLTLTQIDLKKIIAYSSVSHMNLVVIGIFSNSLIGITGSVFTMLAHGIVSSALFLCIGILYERTGTRLLNYYGGIAKHMPIFSFFFMVFIMANMAVPLTANYVGEILLLIGIFETNSFVMVLSSLGIILCAAYSIWLLNRVCFGPTNYNLLLNGFSDLNYREFFILFPFCILVFLMGIFPMWFLSPIEYSLVYLFYYSSLIII